MHAGSADQSGQEENEVGAYLAEGNSPLLQLHNFGSGNFSLSFFWTYVHLCRASLVAQTVKNLSEMRETLAGDIPWRRVWQPTPVFLPRESPCTEEPDGL